MSIGSFMPSSNYGGPWAQGSQVLPEVLEPVGGRVKDRTPSLTSLLCLHQIKVYEEQTSG
jgi:hypothetical protein